MYFLCVSDFTAFLMKDGGGTDRRRSSTPEPPSTNPTSCRDVP